MNKIITIIILTLCSNVAPANVVTCPVNGIGHQVWCAARTVGKSPFTAPDYTAEILFPSKKKLSVDCTFSNTGDFYQSIKMYSDKPFTMFYGWITVPPHSRKNFHLNATTPINIIAMSIALFTSELTGTCYYTTMK